MFSSLHDRQLFFCRGRNINLLPSAASPDRSAGTFSYEDVLTPLGVNNNFARCVRTPTLTLIDNYFFVQTSANAMRFLRSLYPDS